MNFINQIYFIHLHPLLGEELIEGVKEIGFRLREEG